MSCVISGSTSERSLVLCNLGRQRTASISHFVELRQRSLWHDSCMFQRRDWDLDEIILCIFCKMTFQRLMSYSRKYENNYRRYSLCFLPVSTVTSSVNNAAFAAFLQLQKLIGIETTVLGKGILIKAEVYQRHMHTCPGDSKINYCLISLLIKNTRKESARQ